MPFKKIVVPVDFSEYSENAIHYALFFAKTYNAEVTLLHTIVLYNSWYNEENIFKEFAEVLQQREKQYKDRLQQKNAMFEKHGIKIKAKILRSISAADSILEFTEQKKFHLIILGTHGVTGFKKWIYGSVAEKIVRLSKTPVLTIHDEYKNHTIKKILVPIDFSGFAKIAVKKGIDISQKFNAQLEFLHVFDYDFHPSFYVEGMDSIFKFDDDTRNRTIERMVKFTGISQKEANYIVLEGKTYKMIKQYAQENRTNLIILATRGLNELEHFLVGSTTERIISIAPCPVLTVARK